MLEAALGREQQPIRRKVWEGGLGALENFLGRFDLVAALIDHADCKLTLEIDQPPEFHHVVTQRAMFQAELIHADSSKSIGQLVIARRIGPLSIRISAAHMKPYLYA